MNWKDILKNEEKLAFGDLFNTKEYRNTVGQFDFQLDGWKVKQYGIGDDPLIEVSADVLEREIPDYDYDEDYLDKKIYTIKEWMPILNKIVEAIEKGLKTGELEITYPDGGRDMNPEESRRMDFNMGREM